MTVEETENSDILFIPCWHVVFNFFIDVRFKKSKNDIFLTS